MSDSNARQAPGEASVSSSACRCSCAAPASRWENGIFQNCLLLILLLRQSPLVAEAVMVNGGEQVADPQMMLGEWDVPLLSMDEALQRCDVLIEMSAQFGADYLRAFRERGGKVVTMRVGNDYVIDIERAMFNKPSGFLFSARRTTPCGRSPSSSARACTITRRACARRHDRPAHLAPDAVRQGARDARRRAVVRLCAWQAALRVTMFEPNICMVKTSVIPMLVAEEAYRAKPDFLEFVRVCNTLHLKEHATFVHFAKSLDIVNHGITTFESRYAVYEFMAAYGDAVVSHTWENAQNYLYYELLYGDYPLIHNSPFLGKAGYFYPDFDCQPAARAAEGVHRARREPRGVPRAVAARAQFRQHLQPENVAAYTDAIATLYRDA